MEYIAYLVLAAAVLDLIGLLVHLGVQNGKR
jgi:hypothetical protein